MRIDHEQIDSTQENYSSNKNDHLSLTNWGHGSPGIALARLGSLDILDTTKIRLELKTTLENLLQPEIKSLDNLCCGNFADLEVLLLASNLLSNSEYKAVSCQKLARVLSRRDRSSGFQLLPDLPKEIFVPSFSQGIAGIGYGLLRFFAPEQLPSILLWQ